MSFNQISGTDLMEIVEEQFSEVAEDADLRLELRVKNNVLWDAIHDQAKSIIDYCRQFDMKKYVSTISGLISFRISPFKRRGSKGRSILTDEYKDVCLVLSMKLKIPIERLFPRNLYEKFAGTPTTKTLEIVSFTGLPPPQRKQIQELECSDNLNASLNHEDLKRCIEKAFKILSYREREVLKLRYGMDGQDALIYERIGQILKITKERVRQIEAKAIRKIRDRPYHADELEVFIES